MFNSQEYEWSHVAILIFGRTIEGALGVKYSAKQEKKAIYGRGNKPISIQKGNISYEGELKILQSELEAMLRLAKGKGLHDIPYFDVVVSYSADGVLVTDTLKMCQFTSMEKSINQGDTNMEVTVPILFLDLKTS